MKNSILFVFIIFSFQAYAQSGWHSLNEIPKNWTMVERDSLGYLVYNPCNGNTPKITIDSGYITIFWQLDAPTKLSIDKFAIIIGNKSFYINTYDDGESTEFTASLKDNQQQLVLWTFGDFKWVMIPAELENSFRTIDNPCPNEMKQEKSFLPLEF
ncbi:MAG: hypothetical protein K1X55_05670 [Chitinophagales bacterium]|nr:hypothetical protein [Chitinophagales bacterium]